MRGYYERGLVEKIGFPPATEVALIGAPMKVKLGILKTGLFLVHLLFHRKEEK